LRICDFCVKIRKNSRILRNFHNSEKFVQIRFIASLVTCKDFEFAQHLAVDYTEATVEFEQWAVEDCDSDTGEDSEAAGDS